MDALAGARRPPAWPSPPASTGGCTPAATTCTRQAWSAPPGCCASRRATARRRRRLHVPARRGGLRRRRRDDRRGRARRGGQAARRRLRPARRLQPATARPRRRPGRGPCSARPTPCASPCAAPAATARPRTMPGTRSRRLARWSPRSRRIVTRAFDIFDPVVVTVGEFRAGTQRNIIPETATFEATVRSFSAAHHDRLRIELPALVRGIGAAHGLDVEAEYDVQYPVTVNTPDETDFAMGTARELFGPGHVRVAPQPASGSEDFSMVLSGPRRDVVRGRRSGGQQCRDGADEPLARGSLRRRSPAPPGRAPRRACGRTTVRWQGMSCPATHDAGSLDRGPSLRCRLPRCTHRGHAREPAVQGGQLQLVRRR